jgi:predicted membrane protein
MIGDTSSSALMIPLALIIGGLVMVFRSKKSKDWHNNMEVVTSNENTLNVDVTFGGRKEIVTSKEFKGGNISATFGGCEINMTQADAVEQPMVLNVKVSFGGVELVVPSHWELQNEIEPTFGSVEDHRAIRTSASSISEVKKVLILKGTCSFGSIEIKSY